MSDLSEARLDEALRYWSGAAALDPNLPLTLTGDQIIDFQVIVAAARNWHALTVPTQEMVNRLGIRLAVELNHAVASFSPLVLGPNTERIARNLLDALTDTAEPRPRRPFAEEEVFGE